MRIQRLITALILSAAVALGAAGCAANKQPGLPSTEAPEASTQAPEIETVPVTEEPETEAETEAQTEVPQTVSAVPPEAEVTVEAPSLAVGQYWFVNVDQLNVRDVPSVQGNLIAEQYRDEEVLIMSIEGDGWVRIKSATVPDGNGYVHSDYLSPVMSNGGGHQEPAGEGEAGVPVSDNGAAAGGGSSFSASANGHIVCIDAGHQQHGISETEPNAPGSSVMKAKLTTGTQGTATGLTEYQLNLDVSLMLKAELLQRGYQVVMIRETNDCPMSNAERAVYANNSGAEVFLRVHANSSDNPEVRGAMFYAPSPANPYLSAELINASNSLAATMLNAFCATTGLQNRGVLQADDMTGINWCSVPVTIAEMGFMSNPDEDRLMADPAFQAVMARGLADGVDAYFGITR